MRKRPKNKQAHRLPVDADKLTMENPCITAPLYYYDLAFNCKGCGKREVWTAAQQKWWYEDAGGNFFSSAVRCRACRKKERQRVEQARKNSGHV